MDTAEGSDRIGLRMIEALRSRALVRLAAGDHRAAFDAAREAVSTGVEAGTPLDAARAQILAARALSAGGQADDAVATLRQAQATLAVCGAHRYRDEAARELRQLGHRVPRAGRPRTEGSPASPRVSSDATVLSPREQQVAELVALGLTNRQIGADLHLSDRTVESHLAKAFSKLGVSNRAAVAARIRRATT